MTWYLVKQRDNFTFNLTFTFKYSYNILVGEPEGKRPLGSPRCRWEDNIRMDLGEIWWDWIHLAQDRHQWCALVNTVMNLRVQ
jgi:hypothetical protein